MKKENCFFPSTGLVLFINFFSELKSIKSTLFPLKCSELYKCFTTCATGFAVDFELRVTWFYSDDLT